MVQIRLEGGGGSSLQPVREEGQQRGPRESCEGGRKKSIIDHKPRGGREGGKSGTSSTGARVGRITKQRGGIASRREAGTGVGKGRGIATEKKTYVNLKCN